MTEKRFTLEEFGLNFIVNDNGRNLTAKQTVDKLNQLYEENEQLKQQIQQLQHWNNCLAEKRHQELSYKPYTASKSEKELKELLEPKLFNCGDR